MSSNWGENIQRVAWVFWKKLGCSVDFGYKQIVHYYLHCCVLLWIGLFLSYFIPLCGAFRMYIEHTILSQTKLQRHLNGFMWYIIKNSLLNEQSKWNEYFFFAICQFIFCVTNTFVCDFWRRQSQNLSRRELSSLRISLRFGKNFKAAKFS